MFPRRGLGLARYDKMSKQQSLFCFLGGKGPLSESMMRRLRREKSRKKNCEDCRDRKFLPQWLETFPWLWLTYKEDSGLMFCKVRFLLNWFHLYRFSFCFVLVCLFFVGFLLFFLGGGGGGGVCFGAS